MRFFPPISSLHKSIFSVCLGLEICWSVMVDAIATVCLSDVAHLPWRLRTGVRPRHQDDSLGPILGICQLYHSIFPLFLPVHKVCHPILHVWSAADDPCITHLLPMCRNRSEVYMYIWQHFQHRKLALPSWRSLWDVRLPMRAGCNLHTIVLSSLLGSAPQQTTLLRSNHWCFPCVCNFCHSCT